MAQQLPATSHRDDPRFALRPAELVDALVAGRIRLDLRTYPDADTALYARISIDRKDKTSVERQLEIDIAYAQEHRLSYVVYVDRKSAYAKGVVRPDFNAALEAIRARRIKRLVAYKIDRLYRQVEELMDIIKIADGGRVPITLIGVDDEDVFDLTTGKGCDQAIGRVLEAQKESRRISQRMQTQRQKARERGIPSPGVAAFGWRDKMNHDEAEAEALRDAYQSVLHGTSVNALVHQWNKAGLKTARGGRWGNTELKRLLVNQRNVGRLVHTYEAYDENGNKRTVTEIVKENAFPPIVDVETFDAVQRILAERAQPLKHPRRRSMLTGIVRCARCGNVMTRGTGGKTIGRQQTPIYRCIQWAKRAGCSLVVNAAYLQGFVEDSLFEYIDSAECRRRVAELRETGTERADLIAKLDRLSKKRDTLRSAMLADDYDDDLDGYQRDVRELGAEIKRVEAELALTRPVHPALEWAGKGPDLREAWKRFDDDERREIIRDAFGQITVGPSRVRGPGFDPKRVTFGAGTEVH